MVSGTTDLSLKKKTLQIRISIIKGLTQRLSLLILMKTQVPQTLPLIMINPMPDKDSNKFSDPEKSDN